MPISSPGLGSGLDVTGIVSQLMAVEQQPLLRLNQKEALVQAEISAYGALKGGLSSLQDALGSLKDAATFRATRSTSSDNDVVSVSSTEDAVASSYGVDVDRLAQRHKLGTTEFAATTTFGGAAGDTLTLTVGSENLELDLSGGMTFSQIQEAINTESNATGVTAGLISGDNGNQTLVLTASETGFDNRVQLSYGGAIDAATFGFSMLNLDGDDQPLATENELNASLTVDGVPVTRGSNSIDDVVDGLTLNLQGPGQSTVNITENLDVAQNAVNGFVSAYNSLKDQLTALSAGGSSSSLMRGIESQLRGVLNSALSGLGDFSYISELGVTTNSDTGKLELDSSKLTTAMESKPDSVLGFFSDTDSGFAQAMDSMLDGFLQSGGTIDSFVSGANSRIDTIERSRESMERRLEGIEQRYLNQFAALDTLMASMTTTSEYLATQLDALANLASGNNDN